MTKTKKGLSIFLVVLMIITAIPLAVLSETAADTDEVVYNLGNQEITVGYDAKQAEISPWNYKLFDDNGNYTIQLEDNAFFPYEVQFKYGDAVLVEWFETPDSSVQIGGHTFYVHTEQNDDTKLSQIGLWIGDEYIAARPAPKTFTNPLIMPMSLLPIAEERLTVDLTGLLPFELTKVELSTLCSASVVGDGSITGGLSAVYARRFNDDNFTVLTDENAIMDLSALVFGIKEDETLMIQLIVGSALQLDYNNIRYIVTIKLPLYKDLFNFEVRNLAGEMQNVISIDFRRSELHNHEAWIGNYFLAVESQDQTESTLEIDFSTRKVNGIPGE